MKTLNLSGNQLTSVETELLPLNNLIEEFLINDNKIDYIDKRILRSLRRAKLLDFTENYCINMKYKTGEDIGALRNEILAKCSEE